MLQTDHDKFIKDETRCTKSSAHLTGLTKFTGLEAEGCRWGKANTQPGQVNSHLR